MWQIIGPAHTHRLQTRHSLKLICQHWYIPPTQHGKISFDPCFVQSFLDRSFPALSLILKSVYESIDDQLRFEFHPSRPLLQFHPSAFPSGSIVELIEVINIPNGPIQPGFLLLGIWHVDEKYPV